MPRGSQPTTSNRSSPFTSKKPTYSVPEPPGPPGLMNRDPAAGPALAGRFATARVIASRSGSA